jgi:Tol biopolymer transport system component
MANCPPANKWAIAVWDGPGTGVGEALGACGEGAVDSAYYIDPDSQLWLRYLAGRPDLSNLEALDNMQGVIAHGSGEPGPSAASPPGEGEMHNCPLPGKWAIAVWDGVDVDTSGALSNCAEEIDFAYHLDPDSQMWLRWFAGLPEISNLETVNGGRGLLAHGKATFGPVGPIAFASIRDSNLEIYVMNSDGTGQTRLTNNSAQDDSPAWSPDRSKIAFVSDRDGNNEIYVMSVDGSGQTRLTNKSANDFSPAWSPDGAKIAFASDRDGNLDIYVMSADGSGQTRLTFSAPAGASDPAWSPDGGKIAFSRTDTDGDTEIYVMAADGTGQTKLTSNTTHDEEPAWSPDSSLIAFTSLRDGNWEIYGMNADGTGQTRLTNNSNADRYPTWSPDGFLIAFFTDRDFSTSLALEIYVMKANGSGQANLTNSPKDDWRPAWSP